MAKRTVKKRSASRKNKQTSAPKTNNQWMPWVVGGLAFLLFATGFSNPMLAIEDHAATINHPAVRNFSLETLSQFNLGMYTPLTWIGYAFAYMMGADNAFWYHLLAALVHAANAYLVFRLFYRLAGHATTAFLLALFFAIHPIQVEAISWVALFSTPLFTLFSLLALQTYVQHSKEAPWGKSYWFTLGFFILACLSNPVAIALPLTLLVVDLWLERAPLSRSSLLEKTPFFLLAIGFWFLNFYAKTEAGIETTSIASTYSIIDRVLLASHTILFYWTKTLVPLGLSLWYPFERTATGGWPWMYYAAPLVLALILGLAWRFRQQLPFVFRGLLFYLANILFVLPFHSFSTAEPRADHYNYLAILGVFSIIAALPVHFRDKRPRLAERLWVWLFILGLAWLLIAAARIRDWRDTVVLIDNSIEHQGDNFGKAYLWRGMAYSDRKDVQSALENFSKALQADSTLMDAYKFRGALFGFVKQYDRSLGDLNKYLEHNPDNPEIRYNRGLTLVNMSRYKEALIDFNRTLELNPDFERAYRARGNVRIQLGDQEGGDEDLKEWERRSGLPGK